MKSARTLLDRHWVLLVAFAFLGALAPGEPRQDPGQDSNPPAVRGQVASRAHAMELRGLDGETAVVPDVADAKTRVTVLVFWSTWSQPSQRELARLTKLWSRWQHHGVRVLAVNVESARTTEEESQAVRDWISAHPMPFPVFMDRGLEAFHAYGVIAVPTTIVIDSAGTIIFRLPGYPVAGSEQLVEAIEGEVIVTVDAMREVSPSTPEHRRAIRRTRLARLLMHKGQFELAEYTLRRAIDETPEFLEARLLLARFYERAMRLDDATSLLLETTERFGEDSRLLLAWAGLKLRQGELRAAESLARRALQSNPSHSTAMLVLASVHQAEGEIDSALALLLEAARINPLDVEVHRELGIVHEALEDKEGALEWYEKTYRLLDPEWTP